MALWKAVSDRYEQLLATWDSGRVGPTERLRLSTLIWGRLDAAHGSAGSRCRCPRPAGCPTPWRPAAGPARPRGVGAEITDRIRQLRAQLERIRDQVDLEPAGAASSRPPPGRSPGWPAG